MNLKYRGQRFTGWQSGIDRVRRRDSVFVVKQSQDMVNKTFRFPQELLDKLERVAREKNVSVNNLVKQCCEYALGDLPKEEK